MADLTAIQFLRTATAGKIPTAAQLHEGALAINLADRTIYTKNASGQIIDLGFGKGGSVNGSIDATGTVKAGKLETVLADLTTANITTLNVTNLNNTGLTNIANSLNIYGIFGDSNKRLTLTSVPGQTVPMNIRSEKDGSANNLVFEIGPAKLATMKLFDSPSSGYTGRFDINSYLYVDAPSQFNNTLYSRQSSVDYSIDALSPHVYSGSGDVNGLNHLLKTRAHTGSSIFHLLADGRAATLEGLALYHGNGPQYRMVTFGANYTSFANSISVGFGGVSSLGPASIALGASGTGFVLSNDAIHTMAGGTSMANVSYGGVLTVLRSITGSGAGLPANNAIFKANTDSDANSIGDGVTHIGYKDGSGNFNHYFRGKGSTNIDTHGGLIVNYDLLVKRNASISGVLNASTLTGSGSSTSYKGLTIENTSAGWSYIELKALNAVAHIALKTEAAEGAVANSLHLRPNGQQNGSLIIQPAGQMLHLNQYGTVSIGALNAYHAHFNTSLPQFYFYKDIVSAGNFFAEEGQKVFHQGFLPTATQLGVLSTSGGTMSGNINFANGRLTMSAHNIYYSDNTSSAASGIIFNANVNDPAIVAFGSHWNGTTKTIVNAFVVGTGSSWWGGDLLKLDPNGLLYVKSQGTLYGDNRKPTANDVGAYTKAEVNSIVAGSASRPIDLGLTDLNTLYTPGIYYQGSNANTSLDRGYPVLLAGSLIVTHGAGQQQRYHVYNSNTIYTRSRYTGAWTDWVLQYNAQNKPSLGDIGAQSWSEKLDRFTYSAINIAGQDIQIHGKRALVGTLDGNLIINYAGDFQNGVSIAGYVNTGGLNASGNISASNNMYANLFVGNGSALTGLTSAQVGLGNVPNTVHTTAANANTVVVRDGSGWVNAAGFRGNGSQLTNLSWSNIVGRPADTNQWYTVHNSPGSGTQTIALPSAMVNHLVAGQMVKIRVWFNRSNSQRSERRMREMIIDGADGWAGVQWDVWIDAGWPNVSYCYVRNNVTSDVNLRNTISSQYSNITRFEYQLL